MSLKDRIKQKREKKTKFIVVAGPRFGGKTGALGTLPGKTLVIEITDKESGSDGAIAVASISGNDLDVVTGTDCADVAALTREALESGEYDNVAVDGISALSEIEVEKPKIAKMLGGGNSKWEGWRLVGNEIINLIQHLKQLSAEYNKPVIMTLALKEKTDVDGSVVSTDVDTKGNMSEGFIRGKCPFYVVARMAQDAEGNPIYVLQTKDDGIYGARLDGVLANQNPKGFRTEIDKVEEGQQVGFAALLDFLGNYWNK